MIGRRGTLEVAVRASPHRLERTPSLVEQPSWATRSTVVQKRDVCRAVQLCKGVVRSKLEGTEFRDETEGRRL
jgi:hypothetical protein